MKEPTKREHNPHDEFFKKLFSDKAVVIDYVRNFLPKELVDTLQLAQIEQVESAHISPKLKEYYSDIVYICPTKAGESVFVSLLFEHKAQVPKYPHLQLLRYLVEMYEQQAEDKSHDKKLRPIIPIVLYHGKDKWTKKPFSAYISGMTPVFQPFVPHFDYHLTDLSKVSDEEILLLKAGLIINAFLLMKHFGEDDYIQQNFKQLFGFVHMQYDQLNGNLVQSIFVYLARVTEIPAPKVKELSYELNKELNQLAMTAYDMLIQQGEKIGIRKGEEIGIQKGEEIGIRKGEEIRIQKEYETIKNMLRKGLQVELIADIMNCSMEYINKIKKEILR